MLQLGMYNLKYIQHYPKELQQQVAQLIEQNRLKDYLTKKYPQMHDVNNDKLLYEFVMKYKNEHFKKYQLSKVAYDSKLQCNNSLGNNTFVTRIQGSKLKTKNNINIATVFKKAPFDFLEMIVVHELAHLKIKEHNKAFYNLCQHIQENYAQIEFDFRLFLTHIEHDKNPFT